MVLFGTAILVPDDREHFARLSVCLDPPSDDLQIAAVRRRTTFDEGSVNANNHLIICFAGLSGFRSSAMSRRISSSMSIAAKS
jgi:hypothetical protein